ncbi:type VI secretion system tip protein VgrG [Geobacter hydrogenophilus]|uniref:Type VI secretion protein n=2 Tax=Geobacter hydrogenophilus TaxID=40983 RepID=A0A9W6LD15_9BACT|nr:type VI secretion system tip protein VgrG [Geobacter hydrogenophilus]MBT0895452.1 type VI secretion system tip protein VgrG [Geobacter hydrogenophilus]GLI38324.1 type VI secretion protein [Geobacter hydrogenophilus]
MFNHASEARFLFSMTGTSVEASVVHLWAREALSAPFQVQVTLATEFEIESPSEIIGKEALVTIINDDQASGGEDRFFHGIVRRFEEFGSSGKYLLYEAEVVPAFWQRNLRSNCRIFQEMQVQDIIKKILEEGGITSDRYRFALMNKNRLRGFCVQYRESDFDFVSRLLEEEGMFYSFEHYRDKHVIVIGDAGIVHVPITGSPQITFNPNGGMVPEKESIHSFSYSEKLCPDSYTHRNFFFKHPSVDLTARKKGEAGPQTEIYDYPGPYVAQERGDYLARVRHEEQTALQCQAEAQSTSCRIIPGSTFSLADHPARHLNAEYLLVSVTHVGEQPQALQEEAGGACNYGNTFLAIPASVSFRPRRGTPKPVVRGLQTAIVTGPPGEEIHTDRYGRVKVQFHWDREGERNDTSSCWLRPAQGWGGSGWGMLFTPRVGDEVLVDFLEGDPDRPMIVGSAYNEENLPLYEQPFNKTVSAMRTRSYPNDTGSNELRFEDRKAREEIYLHGQKDWTIGIENDKNQTVGHDESMQVGNNRTKFVGVNQTVTVGRNHSESIGDNKRVSIGLNRTETVAINTAETIGAAKELTIGGLYQISVGGAMNETVIGAKAEEVGAVKAVFVGAHMTQQAMANRESSVGENLTTVIDGNHTVKAKAIHMEGGDEIIFRTGKAMISMKSNGEIVVLGGNVTTKGAGEVRIKGKSIAKSQYTPTEVPSFIKPEKCSLRWQVVSAVDGTPGPGVDVVLLDPVTSALKVSLVTGEDGRTERQISETSPEEYIAFVGSGEWAIDITTDDEPQMLEYTDWFDREAEE